MSDPGASPLRLHRVPLVDQPGVLVVLTLDRPAVMNAIDDAMLAALHAALDGIETDDDARGVVVAAAGNGAGWTSRSAPASPTTTSGRSGR